MKQISVITLLFVLAGCASTGFDGIREVELFPMGDDRYTLFVRGNSFVTNSDVKAAWYETAEQTCPDGFNVEEIETKKLEMGDWDKPAIEGEFFCIK